MIFPKEGRDEYLSWLHEVHIPEALSRKGYLWAAHYQADAQESSDESGAIKWPRPFPWRQAMQYLLAVNRHALF